MEVYVDDLLVKSKTPSHHLANLWEAFTMSQCYQMKLNLEKCAFNISLRRFLGFLVLESGIELDPNKVDAILLMEPP